MHAFVLQMFHSGRYIKLTDLVDQIFPPLRHRPITSNMSSISLTVAPGTPQPLSSNSSISDLSLHTNISFSAPLPLQPALEIIEEQFNDYNYWRQSPGVVTPKSGVEMLHRLGNASIRERSASDVRMRQARFRKEVPRSWDASQFRKDGYGSSLIYFFLLTY
jgi:hypothetical protein